MASAEIENAWWQNPGAFCPGLGPPFGGARACGWALLKKREALDATAGGWAIEGRPRPKWRVLAPSAATSIPKDPCQVCVATRTRDAGLICVV